MTAQEPDLPPTNRDVDWYSAGYAAGYRAGHDDAERESADAWRPVAERVRGTAREPLWRELMARRGEVAAGGGRYRSRPRPGDYRGGPVEWPTSSERPGRTSRPAPATGTAADTRSEEAKRALEQLRQTVRSARRAARARADDNAADAYHRQDSRWRHTDEPSASDDDGRGRQL